MLLLLLLLLRIVGEFFTAEAPGSRGGVSEMSHWGLGVGCRMQCTRHAQALDRVSAICYLGCALDDGAAGGGVLVPSSGARTRHYRW